MMMIMLAVDVHVHVDAVADGDGNGNDDDVCLFVCLDVSLKVLAYNLGRENEMRFTRHSQL